MKLFITFCVTLSFMVAQTQVRSITIGEAKQIVDTKSALIVDARNPKDFETGHFSGAINQYARWRKLDSVFSSIKKDRLILVYCSNSKCPYADRVAGILQSQGFSNLLVYHGGVKEWKEAGYELKTGKNTKKNK